ncbi:hypothetical protein HHK36_025054 [Tetracentron sinense]|uniref:Protein kinase domain-containing protein n=1 Tax=Tetracentron sinense TaxID=13715 RepID=A0A835D7B1_TETSI|nr:hypothetical protein HHK36_025054 [Tetracentron sinense]
MKSCIDRNVGFASESFERSDLPFLSVMEQRESSSGGCRNKERSGEGPDGCRNKERKVRLPEQREEGGGVRRYPGGREIRISRCFRYLCKFFLCDHGDGVFDGVSSYSHGSAPQKEAEVSLGCTTGTKGMDFVFWILVLSISWCFDDLLDKMDFVISCDDLIEFLLDLAFLINFIQYLDILLHKAQPGMFCGQEVGNLSSFAPSRAPSDHTTSSLLVKGVARNGSPPWRDDDQDGHYMFALGENLTSRYKIHGKMGEGTFGQVLECWDRERKEMVAIKIVRGIKKYREAAMIEIEVLQQLGKYDKSGSR